MQNLCGDRPDNELFRIRISTMLLGITGLLLIAITVPIFPNPVVIKCLAGTGLVTSAVGAILVGDA